MSAFLAEWFTHRSWDPAFVVMAGAAFAVALTGLWLVRWRRREPTLEMPAVESSPAPPADSADLKAASEQRGTRRRVGTWLKVFLRDPQTGEVFEGHVVDHAPGGVGLTLFRETQTGAVLGVRGVNVPASVPWVDVEVRSCTPLGDNLYRVGARTADTTLWESLHTYI